MECVKVAKHDFHLSLSGSLLSSAQISELYDRVKVIPRDRLNYMFDGQLVDAFFELFKDNTFLIDQVRNSLKDENCTKDFYSVSETLSVADAFLLGQEREDGRHYSNYRVAKRVFKDMLKIRTLEPVQLTTNTNPLTMFANKNAVCGSIAKGYKKDHPMECLDAALRIKRAIATGKPFPEIWYPAMVGHRAQLTNIVDENSNYTFDVKHKDRLVWVVDGGTVLFGSQYFLPLIQHMSQNCEFYAGGKEPDMMRRLIREASEFSNWIGSDYSRFDSTVPSWLIADMFDLVKQFYPKKYWQEISWSAYNFIHTWLVLPGGKVVQKHRGIPSGDIATQVIGTMCNIMMTLTYLASTQQGNEDERYRYVKSMLHVMGCHYLGIFAMGDDNLFFTTARVSIDDMASYVYRVFGVKINAEKSGFGEVGTSPEFLKREWTRFGEYQDPVRLVINVTHPEHRREYNGYSPWHIIYGLFLTYRASFRDVDELELLHKIEKSGGIDAFKKLNRHDLPGVMRAYGDNSLRCLSMRAKALLRQSA